MHARPSAPERTAADRGYVAPSTADDVDARA